MKTVLLVFGTRPEAVKMCPLVLELRRRRSVRPLVCVTGQHRQLLPGVLAAFGVTPDYYLGICRRSQSLVELTAAMLPALEELLRRVCPDIVLVHGDTATTFAASLACFYLGIPVGHVEAGLRSGDLAAPFPEEYHRRAVGLVSRWDFAPTPQAAANLRREGKEPAHVIVTGNTVIDALRSTVRPDYTHPELAWAAGKRLILITAHRRENLGSPMRGMFRAIRRVLDEHADCRAVFPLHPNPAVRRAAAEELGRCDRIHLIEPLEVTDCHNFAARCHLCLTDSGGLQEECSALGVPVLVLRDATERPEGVESGALRLAGTGETGVYAAFTRLLDDPEEYSRMALASNPWGDGRASERIADVLEYGKCAPWEPKTGQDQIKTAAES